MFNLSSCTIALCRESQNYVRVAWLLSLCAIAALFSSSWVFLLKLSLLILLLWQLIAIIRHPVPYRRWRTLQYSAGSWHLYPIQGEALLFDKLEIVLDTGYSFLLRLQANKQQKILVIFNDQLAREEYHWLRLMVRVT